MDIEIIFHGGSGSKWGVSDWYEELETALVAALKKGKQHSWTTGWYSSKKEIACASIAHVDGIITIDINVTDDLDTMGNSESKIPWTEDLDVLRAALDNGWEDAEENRKENQVYVGFSIGREGRWEETLILPVGDGHDMKAPGGDCYHQWGWQEETEIPSAVREALRAWAENGDEGSFEVDGWIIRRWE